MPNMAYSVKWTISKRAKKFYEDVLGWKIVKPEMEEVPDYRG
ncbi:MAG: hypothetical protein U0R44_01670 [Candidatus Micrarchaeia archaeon]